MILSVSRRTDIPNYYSDWFFNRIKEGFLYVRNPMNHHQVSKIPLGKDIVDCIVFWTKNPSKMIPRLSELSGYSYYFQYTLNGYDKSIEKHVPDMDESIRIFRELSSKIGKDKVIWRYDPVFISENYLLSSQIERFRYILERIAPYTNTCIISFIDIYVKNSSRLHDIRQLTNDEINEFSKAISQEAEKYSIKIKTCAETVDLACFNIQHGSCIDKQIIEEIIGCQIFGKKDSGQRLECGCIESREVGSYNSCPNGCIYCYANYDESSVIYNLKNHDVDSPLLIGKITNEDKITVPKLKSLKKLQYDFFDL